MTSPAATARRLFDLTEPIGVLPYLVDEPTEELLELGLRGEWDAYFAGRCAPLGRVPAEVVHALFYNFADGEAARHVPAVWEVVTPEAALAARDRGVLRALRRLLTDVADGPEVARAAELLARAASSAPTAGRPMYAALRALPVPAQPLALLFHAATLLREHRGDGHQAVLLTSRISGVEAHLLLAMSQGTPAKRFGRVHHLSEAHLDAVLDGLRERGLVDDRGHLTEPGQQTRQRVEGLTDELAAEPYHVLTEAELEELIGLLTGFLPRLQAAGSPG